MAKKSVTVRIDKDLLERFTSQGMTQTEAIEKSLSYAVDNCQDLKGYTRQEKDIHAAVLSAFVNPDIMGRLQGFIGDAVREASRGECQDLIECMQGTVKQICNTREASNLHERKTVRRDGKTVRRDGKAGVDAQELVNRVMKIKEADGCGIREACKKAGTSWPTFYRRREELKAGKAQG